MAKSNATGNYHQTMMVQVRKVSDLPKEAHYAIMVYVKESRTEYEPPYHPRDKEGSYSTREYTEVQHWVTTNKEVWKNKILELEKHPRTGQTYVAFYVSQVADVKLNVVLDVDIK